jgi:phosphatidylglycerol lysyltransferase
MNKKKTFRQEFQWLLHNPGRWGVQLAAFLTAGMGLVNLFSAVIPALHARLLLLNNFIPLEILHGSRLASALAGFALLLLANSLSRRKRMGWLLTLIVLSASIVFHLIKGLDIEEASLSGGLILLLVLLRPNFHANSDPPSVRQGLLILLQAFLFTIVYGVSGLFLLDRHYSIQFGWLEALQQIVIMFVSFNNPGIHYITSFGKYFLDSIYIVAIGTIGYALLMLIRPVLVRQPATTEERKKARQIIENFGHTALARPALFEDKSYYFSPGGSVIAFACRGGGAIALTDPIGPPGDAGFAIAGFRDFCSSNDWQLAFASVYPEVLPYYHQAGFESLYIANEAIVILKDFSMEGSASKKLRNAVTKISRLGYKTEFHLPPLPNDLVVKLKEISDEWLTMKSGGEMRFAMGWFDNKYIAECPVMVVYDPVGDLAAFTNLVTEYQANEITIDLMRHHVQIENGVMEFMFVSLLEWAREQGYATFSLGQSALSNVGLDPGDPQMERFLHYVYENFNRFYNFKGLHNFKEKFNPRWEPRYFIYPGITSLPTLLTSLIQVNTGHDNFWWNFQKKAGIIPNK